MTRGLLVAMLAAAAGSVGVAHAGAGAACTARSVAVAFDPRGSVTVTAAGRKLATATFDRRSAVAGCAHAVEVSPPHSVKPRYSRAVVTCPVRRPLQIEAHAIVPSGSQVIVAERGSDTWLVSAVLKPGGSRVYVFSAACRVG
jgi:hypothetical protein